MRKLHLFFCLALPLLLLASVAAQQTPTAPAPASPAIALPAPTMTGGMPLADTLAKRRSVRNFAPTPLTPAELSQILWAAQGITDAQGRRTSPSANAQFYVHVYVADATGFYLYQPKGHQLQKLAAQDLRSKLSGQAAVSQAPAVLLIAGEYERAIQRSGPEKGTRFVILEGGHIAENVLLQAVAIGLSAVPVGGLDPKELQKAASLPAQHTPIYLIPVGHAK